jgi:hypothetical protein
MAMGRTGTGSEEGSVAPGNGIKRAPLFGGHDLKGVAPRLGNGTLEIRGTKDYRQDLCEALDHLTLKKKSPSVTNPRDEFTLLYAAKTVV